MPSLSVGRPSVKSSYSITSKDLHAGDVSVMMSHPGDHMLSLISQHKVGDYYEGEDGNTTLPMTYQGQTTLAILDSEVGVVIATKTMW